MEPCIFLLTMPPDVALYRLMQRLQAYTVFLMIKHLGFGVGAISLSC